MNVVYIIGNGFDLNLGLKTSYQDFYEYFKEQSKDDSFYEEFGDEYKENIKNRVSEMAIKMKHSKTWADLEIALGEYTDEFSSIEEFQLLYYKICDELVKYIEMEEKKMIVSDKRRQKLSNDIISPESYFPPVQMNDIINHIRGGPKSVIDIRIINFNYSRTIERLLEFQGERKLLSENGINSQKVYLGQIIHIHGIANGEESTIVFGVNDHTQIKNESFKKDETALGIMVKPKYNNDSATGIDNTCMRLLKNANLICVFGFSMGDSDKMWCKALGEQLRASNCRVIYFERGDAISANRQQLLQIKKNERKDYFLSKTTILTDQEKRDARNRIWVGYNTKMFALD
jgi:hypothetical protein